MDFSYCSTQQKFFIIKIKSLTTFAGTKRELTLKKAFHLGFLIGSHCSPGWLQTYDVKENDWTPYPPVFNYQTVETARQCHYIQSGLDVLKDLQRNNFYSRTVLNAESIFNKYEFSNTEILHVDQTFLSSIYFQI